MLQQVLRPLQVCCRKTFGEAVVNWLESSDRVGGITLVAQQPGEAEGDPQPETAETVAARIRRALEHIPPQRLIPAPDCGMKYIPRDTAFAKLKALTEGAAIVRRELTDR